MRKNSSVHNINPPEDSIMVTHQALDLRGGELLLLAVLHGQRPLDDVLADVVVLGQVEQLPEHQDV